MRNKIMKKVFDWLAVLMLLVAVVVGIYGFAAIYIGVLTTVQALFGLAAVNAPTAIAVVMRGVVALIASGAAALFGIFLEEKAR